MYFLGASSRGREISHPRDVPNSNTHKRVPIRLHKYAWQEDIDIPMPITVNHEPVCERRYALHEAYGDHCRYEDPLHPVGVFMEHKEQYTHVISIRR